jgi:hypothetical protein
VTEKSDHEVTLSPQDPILEIFESIFTANTKPYAKWIQPDFFIIV